MPNKRKDLRSSRANPASTGTGKKRAAGKKSVRRSAWRRTWLRVLLILSVAALPLLAAALAGPSIRGGSRWQGVLKGMRITTQDKNAGSNADDNSGAAIGGQADFGQVGVRLFNPITRGRLLAEFDLEGVAVLEDGPELKNIIKNKYRFVREQATIAVRNSTAAELADPKLKLLERRVLIRINRSLERPLLKSVTFSKFKLAEATPELDLLGKNSNK